MTDIAEQRSTGSEGVRNGPDGEHHGGNPRTLGVLRRDSDGRTEGNNFFSLSKLGQAARERSSDALQDILAVRLHNGHQGTLHRSETLGREHHSTEGHLVRQCPRHDAVLANAERRASATRRLPRPSTFSLPQSLFRGFHQFEEG